MLVLRVYSESFGVWLHQPVSLYFSLSFLHEWCKFFRTASHLPQSILLCTVYAKAAPPGMESAVFSYTVGISNFCGMVSTLLASGIVKWSGMVTIGNDCNFDALPYLIVFCQMIIPLVIGLPAIFLIPNKLQTEHLIDWAAEGWYVEDDRNPDADDGPVGDPSLSPQTMLEPHLL